jgi:hypothetical protein
MEDMDIADPRLLVDDSVAEILELEDGLWINIAQLCSVMSVYWLKNNGCKPFKSLSGSLQLEIVSIVASNNSPESQFEWARDHLGYKVLNDSEAAAMLPPGEKVLFYNGHHVCAAIVTNDKKWLVYDPEVASAEEYDMPAVAQLYLAVATAYLHGR